MNEYLKKTLKDHNVTVNQLSVLYFINESTAITKDDLFGQEKRAVNQLYDKSLIYYQRYANGEFLEVTDKGIEVLESTNCLFRILKKGTLNCPNCKEKLDFELVGTMRIRRDGYYSALCREENQYFKVVANNQ